MPGRFILQAVEDAVLTSVTERRAVRRPGWHVRLPGGRRWRYLLLVLLIADLGISWLR